MRIYTIGFTKKNASRFFGLLTENGVSVLVDTRLNNVSQLAGFTKRDDLAFFTRNLCGIDYIHETRLAPSADLLRSFRQGSWTWATYEREYLQLLRDRRVDRVLDKASMNGAALLCSEATPEKCHRRVAAEYLGQMWGDVEVVHL
jgi:uncharacterized protein (DUF488 family)